MVTAGVYLIARSHVIFDNAPTAALVVVIVGCITMLMGAIIGSAKDDIKKSLAGSTMSQIGYMVLAVGLGPVGYVFGIFHLLTHGVFKAGLFLGAGSVMHGMKDNVNMRRYGALRAFMVITFITFLACTLSIMGIPPFSGFWSKDSIIHAAFEQNVFVGALTILAAGITGFYMTRMIIMTFFSKARWEDDVHPHESPKVMTIPLIILGVGAVVQGFLMLYWGDIVSWLEPVVGYEEKEAALPEAVIISMSIGVVLIGAVIAILMYQRRPVPVEPPHGSWLTRAARDELYGNQVNDVLVVEPSLQLATATTWFDTKAVDGFVGWLASFTGALSGQLRRYQSGFARSYALSMVGGAVLVVLALILVRLS
jgi:NADH-quinone oxidoreductase subunit L